MKRAIVAAALLIVSLAGLVVLLPLALNSDVLRTALARQLSEASGAQVAFNGPIRFSVFPNFGIVADDLAYTSQGVSMSAERSVGSVELMSLFSDQIRVTGIELRSPRIILADTGQPGPVEELEPTVSEADDVIQVLAVYLERIAIDHVTIVDGQLARDREGAVELVATDIDLGLSVPGIDAPVSLDFVATIDGSRTEFEIKIGSLRNLLDRQPATFFLSASAEAPPHPALARIKASGSLQLADDGSYRIIDGEIDSSGQTMRLDASYSPGTRPFIMARVAAGALDYSDWTPVQDNSDETIGASVITPDLSPLAGIDADVELRAEAVQVGRSIARNVVLAARLENGELDLGLGSPEIAGGSLAAQILTNINQDVPQSGGSLNLAGVDIESLMALAGQAAPATGRLNSQLQFAFQGLDADKIRNSVNLRGSASISDGRIETPQLAAIAGPGAAFIDALNVTAQIGDVRQPLSISGSARWNGEAVNYDGSLTLADLLWAQPVTLSLDLRSQPVTARFSGTITPDGPFAGQADIIAGSLSRALGWLGQDTSTPLGRFAFSGELAVTDTETALNNASVNLDDIFAMGWLSVRTVGKPKITAALAVDTLDFTRLTGGGATASAGSSEPSAIDLAILRQFDADIRLTANQIGYGDIKAGSAVASLSVTDGVARLALSEASFYGGAVAANIVANGAGQVPTVELTASMRNVEALPLLSTAARFGHLEGTLNANLEVNGAGGNSEMFARSLKGPVNVVLSDGAIRGIDVAGLIRNVQSLIASGYNRDDSAKTEFTELAVSLDIENGVGRVDDLRLIGPLVRMSGAGDVNLARQTIDMRLDPRVVGSLDGQGGEFDVSGLGMPIIVTGALAGPSIYPDLSGILANPEGALQALSQLGGNIGQFGTDAAELVNLENIVGDTGLGLASEDVLGGLMGGLTGNGSGNEVSPPSASGQDFLNTIFGSPQGNSLPEAAEQGLEVTSDVDQPRSPASGPDDLTDSQVTLVPLPRIDTRTNQLPAATLAPETPELHGPTEQTTGEPTQMVDTNGDAIDLIWNLIEQSGL